MNKSSQWYEWYKNTFNDDDNDNNNNNNRPGSFELPEVLKFPEQNSARYMA
jgi:hypothetical protein